MRLVKINISIVAFLLIGLICTRFCLAASAVSDNEFNLIKRACVESYPRDYIVEYVMANATFTTPLEFLTDIFSVYLKPGEKFVDLGSGDGRVVFLASIYGVEATGIEWNRTLFRISLNALEKLRYLVDAQKINFIEKDILKCDLSNYDVFYINQGWPKEANNYFRDKLSREAKLGSIVILYDPPEQMPLNLKNWTLMREFFVPKPDGKVKFKVYKKTN